MTIRKHLEDTPFYLFISLFLHDAIALTLLVSFVVSNDKWRLVAFQFRLEIKLCQQIRILGTLWQRKHAFVFIQIKGLVHARFSHNHCEFVNDGKKGAPSIQHQLFVVLVCFEVMYWNNTLFYKRQHHLETENAILQTR